VTIGASIGPYRILRHLGSGGMGAVWLAEDTRLNRQVALKMVRPADADDAAARARLMREARAAAALNHPHIATVHDVLEADGQIVIVFEYVEGETLHARIGRGPIPAPEAVEIAMQIAKALVAAHAQGIVHRDLKPANVIIGAGGHLKVLDFGIARMLAVGTTQSAPGSPSSSVVGFIGTAAYAAPEQMVSGNVDERADLYALGVVLFEMIGGQRPFLGHDVIELASSKLGQEAPPLSSTGELVPPALDGLVASLLSRDRDERTASATDVLSQLQAIRELLTRSGPSVRGILATIAAAVLLLVLSGTGIWQLRQFTNSDAVPTAPVVAVLPLANASGDPSKDFVAAGIAESLISSLASLPSVTVLSRASVAEARSRVRDEAALAKDLGASYLVNGSVQESGGTLKISLNLVKPDRTVAWGDSVEGAFDRIFDLQSQLASALTSALAVRVSARELERIKSQPTTNPDALSAYWRGKALLERADIKGNVDAAIGAFEEALRLDSRFALAHAGLGQAYRQHYVVTLDPSWAQRAVESASDALRLEPNRPEVRYVLALTLAGAGRHDEAIEELHRALALQPNYEDARRRLGLVLAEKGQVDAAIVEFRKAIALRPTSSSAYSTMGFALLQASRYQEAAEAFEEMVRVAPDNFAGYQQLGTAYQFLGDTDRALENYRKAIAIRPSAPAYSNIGTLLLQKRDFGGAVDAYEQAIKIRPNSATTHRNLGDALSGLNRVSEARAAYLEAIRLFEIDLKVNPRDARNLVLLAVASQKTGRPDIARKYVQAALAIAPENADVLYRAATVSALAGETTTALDYLDLAIKRGYSRSFASQDDDLSVIRSNERFQALIRQEAR
jgi:serine/threonine-protein kinase